MMHVEGSMMHVEGSVMRVKEVYDTCRGVYDACITISPHKCLNSGMLSYTFLRSTHSGVLIRTDLGLKPSALPHLKGVPSSVARRHTHIP